MVGVEQLTLEQAAWLPPSPDDESAAKLGSEFARRRLIPRPVAGTNEDRRFRADIETLREHGWPIVARLNGWYELSFKKEDVQAIIGGYRTRARKMLRTSLRVRRVLERRAA